MQLKPYNKYYQHTADTTQHQRLDANSSSNEAIALPKPRFSHTCRAPSHQPAGSQTFCGALPLTGCSAAAEIDESTKGSVGVCRAGPRRRIVASQSCQTAQEPARPGGLPYAGPTRGPLERALQRKTSLCSALAPFRRLTAKRPN